MNTIQELLKKYIEENGYTIYSISKQSDINRTTLQKILSGQRKTTKDIYNRLLPYFALSPIDKDELDQAFLADQIGPERFQTHMEIKRILEMSASSLYLENQTIPDSALTTIDSYPNCTLIEGTYQIANAIYTIALHNVTTEAQPFLYTFADFSHPYASIFFKPLYHPAFQSLHVKQLVEYQKTQIDGENYDNIHNIQILTNLLPSFAAFPGSFSVYFYYSARNRFKQQASAFPFYIITNTHVLLLSPSYETAMLLSDPAIHAYYLKNYKQILTKSNTLTEGAQSPLELLDALNKVDPSTNYPLCLNIQPTIEKYLTPEMIDKYMLDSPYKDILRAKLLERIGQLTMEHHTILFTSEGLKLFSEQGKNINFPDSLAAHFDIEDRIHILQKFIDANENEEDNHFLILDPAKIHTSLNISIAFTPPSLTFLMLVRNDGNSMIIPLYEHTLCNSIMDFIQTLPQYGYVCSPEKTNQILQEEIEKLRKQL
ncbi:helix-turn-helix domain-containing protein [Eubacterium sp. MSJ-33]|uniref:helix-turn-helix domain-containing protein n=1 Tax=Eubacterium sp. MSJ-33 TaxID=2841528 RepID=UPI001C76691E|nr:helix-turn-helix transcriptional regulator [Eubacterium sp. MSJ-33]QWT52620.1 helix-turn-helix domain-containing protein [Eubacterium sp. MSJ-33]